MNETELLKQQLEMIYTTIDLFLNNCHQMHSGNYITKIENIVRLRKLLAEQDGVKENT